MNNVSALGEETFCLPGSGIRPQAASPGRGARPRRLHGTGNWARGPRGGGGGRGWRLRGYTCRRDGDGSRGSPWGVRAVLAGVSIALATCSAL